MHKMLSGIQSYEQALFMLDESERINPGVRVEHSMYVEFRL
jgi:hypothetical protein